MSVPCRYRQFLRNIATITAAKNNWIKSNKDTLSKPKQNGCCLYSGLRKCILDEHLCGRQASEHLSLTNFFWKIPRYSERLKGKLILHFCFGCFVMIGINVSENQNWSSIWFFTGPRLLLGFQYIFTQALRHRDLLYVIFCNPPGGTGCDCALCTNTNLVILSIDCGSLQYTINRSDNYWLEHKQQK